MKTCKGFSAMLAVVYGMAMAASARGEEAATVPYRQLCQGISLDFSTDPASLPHEMAFTIASSRPSVKLTEIRLTLTTAKESHEIPISNIGTFALPVSKRLFDADAKLVSNQPKGTLLTTAVPFLGMEDASAALGANVKDGKISYQEAVQLAMDARQQLIQRETQKTHALFTGIGIEAKITGDEVDVRDGKWFIVLRASENPDGAIAVIEDGPVTAVAGPLRNGVHRRLGEQKSVRKLGPGEYAIPYSEAFLKDNPIISLSPNASWSCAMRVVDN